MSLDQYPAVTAAGADLAATSPAHWPVYRVRHLAQLNPSRQEIAHLPPDTEVSFLPMEAIGESGSVSLEHKRPIAAVSTGYTYMADEDVIVAKVTPCFENGKGALLRGLIGGVCFGTTELIVLRSQAKRLRGDFLYYVTASAAFRDYGVARMYGAGGQKRVPDDAVRELRLALPSLAEQAAIVAFLDRETAKIDALVDQQRRLMELLKEKRQAVISHAVTKGLNPDAPTKPSGIEWLGDVPAHWEIRALKQASSFTTSGPRGWSDRVGETGALFVQSGNLTGNMSIDLTSASRVEVGIDAESKRTELREGDIVVCITGAKTGNVATCPPLSEPAYVNQHLCLIRVTENVCSMFIAAQLKSFLGQVHFDRSQYGLKQGLSLENVRSAPVLIAPASEQKTILDYIRYHSSRYDELVEQSELAIDLLTERRTALITAAVTGQIDVRHLVPAEAA